MDLLPALFVGKQSLDQKTFNSEREILYQVLFDMKKDMNDLKKLVHEIMSGQVTASHYDVDYSPSLTDTDLVITKPEREKDASYRKPAYQADSEGSHYQDAEVYQDVEDVDEPLSLMDMEKKMIKKTLEKYRGRRKPAAEELKISERTLYRKIKEYGLD